jgi:hypothetical protein
MTLQKGRLGIGTTEPEGRLAVADEPHNLEEFPPRAMTGYKNYFEGHGEFCASASGLYDPTIYQPYMAFDKRFLSSINFNLQTYNSPSTYTGGNGVYGGTAKLGGFSGEWLQLELPYKINLMKFSLSIRGAWAANAPEDFVIAGYVEDTTSWVELASYTGEAWTGAGDNEEIKIKNINSASYYKRYALVTSKLKSSNNLNIAEWRLFGTREQGQSVLHDGQLTLTKSLNVPRIGPALDADDTPRRDRLVVEYNTSTNPTFEGAVRDTSGRGNDGVFYGNTYYDVTTKALDFDGLGNDTIRGTQNIGTGEKILTMAMWIKRTAAVNAYDYVCTIGTSTTGKMAGFTINSNRFNFTKYGAQTVSTTTINNGQWYHLVGVYKGGHWTTTNAEIYVDGVKETVTGGTTSALNLTGNQITFGDSTLYDGTSSFSGSISNFKLYDTALTAEEVKTLYDMGRNGSVANPQPLHIAAPLYSPGTIVQVEQSIKTDTFSTTGATSHPVSPGNDVPGLAVTIHPKFANSKILVSYTVSTGAYGRAYLRIQRKQGGSTTTIAPSVGVPNSTDGKCTTSHSGSGDSSVDSQSFEYYDTIGGTEPITYQIQAWTYHSVYYIYVNRGHNDGDGGSGGTYWARTLSSITAKEVCQ